MGGGRASAGLRWRMDDHIWSCCELSVGGQSSLSVGDVLSNLIHSLCEGIHAACCHVDCRMRSKVTQLCLLAQQHVNMRQWCT